MLLSCMEVYVLCISCCALEEWISHISGEKILCQVLWCTVFWGYIMWKKSVSDLLMLVLFPSVPLVQWISTNTFPEYETSIPQSLLYIMFFVLYIFYISWEGVLASYSPLDRWIDLRVSVKNEILSLMASGWFPKSYWFTDIALINFLASLHSDWGHIAWPGKGHQLKQARGVSRCNGSGLPKCPSASRAVCLQWQRPEQGGGCLLYVRGNPVFTYYMLAAVSIIPCF